MEIRSHPDIMSDLMFSQGNLQDYADCNRRFQLKYLYNLKWPAADMEPFSMYVDSIRKGSHFHVLVHQHILGISEEILGAIADQAGFLNWWLAYLDLYRLQIKPHPQCYPEAVIIGKVGKNRLVARYDLIVVRKETSRPDGRNPGTSTYLDIYDWKTSHLRLSHKTLEKSLQTMVYPYLAVKNGERLVGVPVSPEKVRFVYWFAQHPENPEVFEYDRINYLRNEGEILGLVDRIINTAPGEFEKTDDIRHCHFCVYRSLCDRGIHPGEFSTFIGEAGKEDDDTNITLDFDSIAEIEA